MTDPVIETKDIETKDIEDTGGAKTWLDAFPEELRDNPTLNKYKNLDALGAAHISLQAHLGEDKISKPITEDDWNDTYNFLGRPEEATGYELPVDELPDAVKNSLTEESMTSLKSKAHELGLNATQLKGMFDHYTSNIVEQQTLSDANKAQEAVDGEKSLKEEWGLAYEQKLGFAKKAVEEYGGEELLALLEKTGLGNHPDLVKAFAKVGESTMPDNELIGHDPESKLNSPEEAMDKAKQLMAHKAYLDKTHPEHTQLVKKVAALFAQAHK